MREIVGSLRAFFGVLFLVMASITPVSAQDTIKVGFAIQAHQANMMVLPQYAEKIGLKIDLVPMRRFPDLQLALTTKQIDAAVLGYVNLALLEEGGFKNYKVVSGVYAAPGSLVLAPDVDGKVKTWKDLEGKTLGTAPNGAIDIVFRALLKEKNVDVSKIKLISFAALGPPALAALANHDIDGFIAWEPNNAEAVQRKIGVYSRLDIGDNPSKGIQGILVVDGDYLKAHDDAVAKLVKALVDSTNELNANPEEFAAVAVKGTGSPLDVTKIALPHGRLDTKLYQRESEALLDMIYDAGLTKQSTKHVVAEHFDYEYLMKATGKSRTELGGR
jgi:ABC-type nitrate/sulfonate/bicarbonate transport system substrate-binding protein